MSRLGTMGNHLYQGEVSYDFVGRQRRWYAISGVILLLAVIGLAGRGLHRGIEFRGGSEFQVKAPGVSVSQGRDVLAAQNVAGEPVVQILGGDTLRIQTSQLTTKESAAVRTALATEVGVPVSQVSASYVGPSWGRDVSTKALQSLVFFLVLLVIYLSIAFEWKMAAAALVALLHDIVITIGVYALVGFEVTPATVIGLLTILGYSLYDTVVVFDKVRENTAGLTGGSRATYSEAANTAVNQTLVRSINTTLIALLPIGAILFVGAGLLGAGTLKDLSLSLFIGVAAGAYSSIFIATPLLADLKEREAPMKALASRVAQRRAGAASAPTARRKARASSGVQGGSTSIALLDPDAEVSAPVADGSSPPEPAAPAGVAPVRRPPPPRQTRKGPTRRPSGKKKR